MTCPDCGELVDHCHGTLVLHADRVECTAECTDPGCAAPHPAEHALVVGCGEVANGCPTCAMSPDRVTA